MAIPLFVEDLLQVVAVFNELVGLEIARATPPLFKSVNLGHSEMECLSISHAGRQLSLI